MRTCAGIGVVICLTVVTALTRSSTAVESADSARVAKSILDVARLNRGTVPPLSMDVEVTKFTTDNGRYKNETLIERLIKQYRQKGDHLDLASARYLPDGSGGYKDGSFTVRSIWDGQRALPPLIMPLLVLSAVGIVLVRARTCT